MPIRFLNRVRGGGSRAFDADVLLWQSAVVVNGGGVSLARLIIVDQFVFSEKASGAWAQTDDYWGLWGENEPQALMSLKQRRLATTVNSPTFTPTRDYTFDGLTNYISTGFSPSANTIAMTNTSYHGEVYERTNLVTSSTSFGISNGSGRFLLMQARNAGPTCLVAPGTNGQTYTLPVADSRGLTQGGRNGSTVGDIYGSKNGVDMTMNVASTAVGASLPTGSIFIGGSNSSGFVQGRQNSVGFVSVGGALSSAQRLARYNAVQAWATSIGANV